MAPLARPQAPSAGKVNYSRTSNSSIDPYLQSPTTTQQQWMQNHFTRMSVFSPYFDSRTTWYSNGQVYQDLYAIYPNSPIVTQHPDWILHDQYGNSLFIPWGCSNGTCAQYAADIANPNFRAWWINQMQTNLADGNYKGMWIDDVNMNFDVGDGYGNFVAPIDDATGAPMTWTAWRNYVAQFLTQIRQSFPAKEIVHNAVWFAGPDGVRDQDPAIQQEIAAADLINMERGIASDAGMTGGTGPWSMYAQFAYMDRVHAAGRSVVLQNYDLTNTATAQFAVAGYFMISAGGDYHCDLTTTPDNWWSGLDVNLGTPLGPRTYNNGIFQRNFSQGIVILGDPGAPTTTVNLPAAFTTLDGQTVTSVTVSARQGIILTGTYPNQTLPALSLNTSSLPNAVAGTQYTAGLSATGGSGNYSFSVSGAPAGLGVVGSALTGTPATAGSYSTLLAVVKDITTGAAAQKNLPLTVYAPVAVTTTSLPSAGVGKSYSAALSAAGGSGSYTWSATGLPSGIAISGNTISGTPSSSGTANVIVTATDPATSLSSQKALSLTIYSAPAITTSALPTGTVGVSYAASLAVSGGSGNFTWSATGLPSGIALSGSSLGGSPTTAGAANVTFGVTDNVTGLAAQATISLTVYSGAVITTTSLPIGLVGSVYSAALSASGGSGTYVWSASGLPAGIVLTGNTLSGTPTVAGTSSVSVSVTDSVLGKSSQKTLALAVYGAPVITTSSLPSGTVNKAYSASLAASGGSGSYAWSVAGLPAGITASGFLLSGTPTTAGTFSGVVAKVTDQVTGQSVQKTFSIIIAKGSNMHYLSDLAPTYTWQSWGSPQKDLSISDNPLSLNWVKYAKGIGSHAYGELRYNLNGGCSTFSATVGIDDEIPAGIGSLYFQVWGDGRLLYNGPVMQGGSKAIPINVNVSGVLSLGLVATNGIYKAAAWQVPSDHADWANAQVVCTW